MNVFFDTEFTGLHKDTTLISIGLVAEDGRQFYAELTDYDRKQVNGWIRDNVLAHLTLQPLGKPQAPAVWPAGCYCGDKRRIAYELGKWLEGFDEPVQLISDVCAFDWVLFCDLFGGAFGIPNNVSPAPVDINQMIADKEFFTPAEAFDISREELANLPADEAQKHNALWDALVIKAIWHEITEA